jgi:putative GTP pyrophosphokinase
MEVNRLDIAKQIINDNITDPSMSEAEKFNAIGQQLLPIQELMSYYRCALMEVETKFNVLNEEMSILFDRNPIESIKSREKSFESIFAKLQRKGLPMTEASIANNINDIAGIRVICSFQEDVYKLTDALLQQDDVTLITKKDYIRNPKENGYRSMHLIIEIPIFLAKRKKMMRVEIQLRTIAMDYWASLEHKLKYKQEVDDAAHVIQELKDCADIIALVDHRMEKLRQRSSLKTKKDNNN